MRIIAGDFPPGNVIARRALSGSNGGPVISLVFPRKVRGYEAIKLSKITECAIISRFDSTYWLNTLFGIVSPFDPVDIGENCLLEILFFDGRRVLIRAQRLIAEQIIFRYLIYSSMLV
jgi:hypothetical protein